MRKIEAAETDKVRVIRLKLIGPSSDRRPNGGVRRSSLSLSNFLNEKRVKTNSVINSRLKRRGP